MKRNSFFLLSWALVIPVFLLYTNCKSDKNKAHTILQKSIKSHGGMELWKKMKSIKYCLYQKETNNCINLNWIVEIRNDINQICNNAQKDNYIKL